MSATIRWEPVRKGASLYVTAPTSFIATLEAAGMPVSQSGGCLVSTPHLPALRGMAALYSVRMDFREEKDRVRNPYWQLADAIEKHGEVRIWTEY